MALLEVLEYPNPILRKAALAVSAFDRVLEVLVRDMFETALCYDGIGLAAPQIGVSQRVFIMSLGSKKRAIVNPVIFRKEGVRRMEEGCLSLPGVLVEVERAETIEFESSNLQGERYTGKLNGLMATIFQHEYDHLDGVLITDHGCPIVR